MNDAVCAFVTERNDGIDFLFRLLLNHYFLSHFFEHESIVCVVLMKFIRLNSDFNESEAKYDQVSSIIESYTALSDKHLNKFEQTTSSNTCLKKRSAEKKKN